MGTAMIGVMVCLILSLVFGWLLHGAVRDPLVTLVGTIVVFCVMLEFLFDYLMTELYLFMSGGDGEEDDD